MSDATPDRARWDGSHKATTTPTLTAIRRATITAALPESVSPTTVWPTWPLERIAEELQVAPGETLLDLACGRGEIGLWLADHSGAELIGVDPSSVGLDAARRAAEAQGRDATFVDGHFDDIGLPDDRVDGVLVVDAIWLAPDRLRALREIGRVLRAGRRLVLVGSVRPEDDAADFERAGFEVETEIETPEWRDLFLAFFAQIRANEAALRAETSDAGIDRLLALPYEDIAATVWHGLIAARLAD